MLKYLFCLISLLLTACLNNQPDNGENYTGRRSQLAGGCHPRNLIEAWI